jgi:high-affinity Fe2+/Pb2+ permease
VAGVVDSGAVERSLLAIFVGLVVAAVVVCLALVAAVAGKQRRHLVRRSGVVLLFGAIAAVVYTFVVSQGHSFSRLEQAAVVSGVLFAVVCVGLIFYAFVARRSAGA